jgi:glycosyltransferase involved in cell wall biosynthesis
MRETGVERYSSDLYWGLRSKGINVVRISDFSIASRFEKYSIAHAHSFLRPMVYDIIVPLEYILRKYSCLPSKLIIHDLSLISGLLAPLIQKTVTKNIVATVYDLGLFSHPEFVGVPRLRDKLWQLVFKAGVTADVRYSKRIIAISTQTAEELNDIFHVSHKVRTINFCLDPRFKPQKSPADKYSNRDIFVIGCVGALVPRKRFDKAIKTVSILLKMINISSVKLIICGEGPSLVYLKLLAKRLNLSSNVEFRGHIPGQLMPSVYNEFDVLIHPSIYEGFGYPILEAQACGLPVIVFKDSIIPREVKQETLEASDEYEAAHLLFRLFSDETFYVKSASHSRAYAKKFTLDKMINQHIKVYEEVLW